MPSSSPSLTAEQLHRSITDKKLSGRKVKFILRALEETGYKVSKQKKKCPSRFRGKQPFNPRDMPKLFTYMNNLTATMASLVATLTGARREETAEILKANIDFDLCRILLVVTKSGAPQYVYFPHSLAPLLKKWIHYTRESPYLFPSEVDFSIPVSVSTLSRNVLDAVKWSGMHEVLYEKENGHKYSKYGFHSFRKFFASLLVNNRVPLSRAQKLLRHKNIEITQAVYAHYGTVDMVEALSKVDPFAGKAVPVRPSPGMEAASSPHIDGTFARQGLALFEDFRAGRISESEYQRQKAELLNLRQALSSAR